MGTSSLLAGIDSHFMWVKNRITTLNPARKVAGLVAAADWPPAQLSTEAFYCMEVGSASGPGTPTIPVMDHTIQWLWVIQGTDVTTGAEMRSRGDRYRINGQMRAELLNGLYPYFAQKNLYDVDQATGNLTADPVDSEKVFWTPPVWHESVDKDSGLVYGSASVHLVNFTDAILS